MNVYRVGGVTIEKPCNAENPASATVGLNISRVLSDEYGICHQINQDRKKFNVSMTGK